MKPLIIRADANAEIGTGHIMRCMALAQAWQKAGGEACFLTTFKIPAIKARLIKEGFKVVLLNAEPGSRTDAEQTAKIAHSLNGEWLIVDGYHFGTDYQKIIKDNNLKLLFVDDYGHAEHYYADIVLNQNIHADEKLYANKEPYTQLLLGSRYILLRQEFMKWRNWQRAIPNVPHKILVTLGGSDADNVTLKVVQALPQLDIKNLKVVVVVGASYAHYVELQTTISNIALDIDLQSNVINMPELMAWADMTITAGGTTSWELAFMGVPSLVLTLAANQKPVAEWLATKKVAIHLNGQEKLSAQITSATQQLFPAWTREQMSRRGRDLVDGKGQDRVLRQLKLADIKLRPVDKKDCKLIWEWANDPDVRSASFSSEFIPWEGHVKWFNQKIDNPNCIIYIALNGQNAFIGQARFDLNNYEAIISISIDKRFRSRGYGSAIINDACNTIFAKTNVHTIYAHIKSTNKASVQAFIKAGFEDLDAKVINGYQSRHLILQQK